MKASGGDSPLQYEEYHGPRSVFAAISAAVRLKAPDHVLDALVAKGLAVWTEWKGGLRLDEWTSTGYRLNDVWAQNRRN